MPEETKTLLAEKGDTKPAGSPEAGAAEKALADQKAIDDKAAADKAAADAGTKTPEQLAAEKKVADDAAVAAKQADAAPEQYAAFVLPEGVKLDESLVKAFTPIAKELNLSQAKAQKLVDLVVNSQKVGTDAQAKELTDMRAKWQADVKASPNYEENLGLARKALRLADSEATKLLTETWLGDHPAMLRYLAKIGSLVSEDKLIEGAAGGKGPTKSTAELLYPAHTQKP
jgi:hypothetical protein